jgi:hypothetical protein
MEDTPAHPVGIRQLTPDEGPRLRGQGHRAPTVIKL